MSCTMDVHGIIFGMVLPGRRCMVAMAIAADSLLSIVLRAEKLTRVIILAGRQEKWVIQKRGIQCVYRGTCSLNEFELFFLISQNNWN